MTDTRTQRAQPVDRAARAKPRRGLDVVGEIAQAEADATGEEVEVFDPADNTIEAVLSYLDEHPEAVEAVRTLEQAGKARTTLLAELDERIAAAEADDQGPVHNTEADDEEG